MSAPEHASAGLYAVVYDASGRALANQTIHWSSSDSTIAAITSAADGNATVSARRFGSATITASARGTTGTTTACVYGANFPHAVSVLGPATIQQGSSRQYTAIVAGTSELFPAPCVHWSSADSSVATVTRRGLVTGRKLTVAKNDITAFVGVP